MLSYVNSNRDWLEAQFLHIIYIRIIITRYQIVRGHSTITE